MLVLLAYFHFAPMKKPKYILVLCVSIILQTLNCKAEKAIWRHQIASRYTTAVGKTEEQFYTRIWLLIFQLYVII